jgi:predicted metal-dependent HD superfamily phosphohydrolase
MNLISILQVVENHVTSLFLQQHNEQLTYHNLRHTQQVAAHAATIAAHYQLSEADNFVVRVAAWFHDVGYLFGPPRGHEEMGAEKAAAFLNEQQVPAGLVAKVQDCIRATCMPQRPDNLLEQIVCDADLFGFGNDDFPENTKLLRRERELLTGKEITGSEWRTETLQLLNGHQYFTDYARALQQKNKQENIDRMTKREEKQVAKVAKEHTKAVEATEVTEVVMKKAKKKDKGEAPIDAKAKQPVRGIETMFRLTSTNHLQLSAMADSKANILVTVNSIIISVLVSGLFQRFESMPHLVAPTIIFMVFCVVTIIFAVLATRPNVNAGMFDRSDVAQRKTNLLFFGNFYRMKLDEYDWAMREMMEDREYLYGSLIKDIYFLGVVLGRKYRLLRIAYNIFMCGLIISVLVFAVAIIFFAGKPA